MFSGPVKCHPVLRCERAALVRIPTYYYIVYIHVNPVRRCLRLGGTRDVFFYSLFFSPLFDNVFELRFEVGTYTQWKSNIPFLLFARFLPYYVHPLDPCTTARITQNSAVILLFWPGRNSKITDSIGARDFFGNSEGTKTI